MGDSNPTSTAAPELENGVTETPEPVISAAPAPTAAPTATPTAAPAAMDGSDVGGESTAPAHGGEEGQGETEAPEAPTLTPVTPRGIGAAAVLDDSDDSADEEWAASLARAKEPKASISTPLPVKIHLNFREMNVTEVDYKIENPEQLIDDNDYAEVEKAQLKAEEDWKRDAEEGMEKEKTKQGEKEEKKEKEEEKEEKKKETEEKSEEKTEEPEEVKEKEHLETKDHPTIQDPANATQAPEQSHHSQEKKGDRPETRQEDAPPVVPSKPEEPHVVKTATVPQEVKPGASQETGATSSSPSPSSSPEKNDGVVKSPKPKDPATPSPVAAAASSSSSTAAASSPTSTPTRAPTTPQKLPGIIIPTSPGPSGPVSPTSSGTKRNTIAGITPENFAHTTNVWAAFMPSTSPSAGLLPLSSSFFFFHADRYSFFFFFFFFLSSSSPFLSFSFIFLVSYPGSTPTTYSRHDSIDGVDPMSFRPDREDLPRAEDLETPVRDPTRESLLGAMVHLPTDHDEITPVRRNQEGEIVPDVQKPSRPFISQILGD